MVLEIDSLSPKSNLSREACKSAMREKKKRKKVRQLLLKMQFAYQTLLTKWRKKREHSRGRELLPHISKARSSMLPKQQPHNKNMGKEFVR